MSFYVGDLVTRNSYGNDVVFRIVRLYEEKAVLKGVNIRLIADAFIDDLEKVTDKNVITDKTIVESFRNSVKLDRDNYFYLPGKILHLDTDSDYLDRSLMFYKDINLKAIGYCIDKDISFEELKEWLEKHKPDILVLTGHDAYYKKLGKENNINAYKSSSNFKRMINIAREYEKSQDKLIIIAGACQSCYEELIKAGANFASSPKRVNIHALDPAVISSSVALTERSSNIDLLNILDKTKYGPKGMGGIITKGTMYVGYPR
ncbi:MAG: sporulation peptidase YabG [Bacilli bacterium]